MEGSLQERVKYNPLKSIPREAPYIGERPEEHTLKDGWKRKGKKTSLKDVSQIFEGEKKKDVV